MPVIRNIKIDLPLEHVLRREGIRKKVPPTPKIEKLILEMLNDMEQSSLLAPAIAYNILPVEKMVSEEHSPISSLILGAKEIAAAFCTIGKRLEIKAKKYIDNNEPLRALIMDGIGSAAVDMLSEKACNLISTSASSLGYTAGSPISPGMQGLSIKGQRQLFELVPAGEINVTLTDSGTMIPLKSVSMIMGLGAEMKQWKRVDVCASCHLRNTCLYKLEQENVLLHH